MANLNVVLATLAAIVVSFVLRGEGLRVSKDGLRATNGGFCKSAAEWKARSIYFLLTDRFARTPGASNENCNDLNKYCGGTFQGLTSKLDYIKGMGFDAIWISPIMEQVNGDGTYEPYHGYHAKDWYNINPRFGTVDDFNKLLAEADKKGIWVMLDLALNHMGGSISQVGGYKPFNNAWEDYHDCNGCTNSCDIPGNAYDVIDNCGVRSAYAVEHCRLAGLPDLNHDKKKVQDETINLFTKYLPQFNISGYRLDAIKHMPKWYLEQFVTDQTDCFTIGEALFQSAEYGCAQGTYQTSGAVDGVLDFNMQGALVETLRKGSKPMRYIKERFEANSQKYNDVSVNGLFLDNHDDVANDCRWLGHNDNEKRLATALSYIFTGMGIPILYYGTEQGFNWRGNGEDRWCRVPLWQPTNNTPYNENFKYYTLVKKLNAIRKTCKVWQYSQDSIISGDWLYAFRRGDLYSVLTNSFDNVPAKVWVGLLPPGTKMCNIFFPEDCVTVISDQSGKYFNTQLIGGEPKIFVPVGVRESTCGEDPLAAIAFTETATVAEA